MRIKLVNQSFLPDEPLKHMLQHAAVAAHCKGPVVVIVWRGGRYQRGRAHCAFAVKSSTTNRIVRTRNGYVELWPMTAKSPVGAHDYIWAIFDRDYIWYFEQFFKTAVHEFAHVRDFQKGKKFGQYNRRWANRPHERRAIRAADRGIKWVSARESRQIEVNDCILALAIAVEEHHK